MHRSPQRLRIPLTLVLSFSLLAATDPIPLGGQVAPTDSAETVWVSVVEAPSDNVVERAALAAFQEGLLSAFGHPIFWLLALAQVLVPLARPTLAGVLFAFGGSLFAGHWLATLNALVVSEPVASAFALLFTVAAAAGASRADRERSAVVLTPPWLPAVLLGSLIGGSLHQPRVRLLATEAVATAAGTALGVGSAVLLMGLVGWAVLRVATRFYGEPAMRWVGLVLSVSATILLLARLAVQAFSLTLLQLGIAAAALGFVLPAVGLGLRRIPVVGFFTLFMIGTGVAPELVDPNWVRAVAVGSLFLLVFWIAVGRSMTKAGAVTIFAIVVVAFGWHIRQVLHWMLALPAGHLVGTALGATTLCFVGLCASEALAGSRLRAARRVGLALATSVVVLRIVEYVIDVVPQVAGLATAPKLPVPALSLALVTAAVILRPSRRPVAEALGMASRPSQRHFISLAMAFFALPVGVAFVPNPLYRIAIERSPDRLVSELLTSTYLSFNLPGEAEVYDRLSESVVQSLVVELYLDSRRRLRAGAWEADEVTVERVHLVDIAPTEATHREGFTGAQFSARWVVTARIRHLQHVHRRRNLYSGTLELRLEDDRWKLAGVRLSSDDRTVTPLELP